MLANCYWCSILICYFCSALYVHDWVYIWCIYRNKHILTWLDLKNKSFWDRKKICCQLAILVMDRVSMPQNRTKSSKNISLYNMVWYDSCCMSNLPFLLFELYYICCFHVIYVLIMSYIFVMAFEPRWFIPWSRRLSTNWNMFLKCSWISGRRKMGIYTYIYTYICIYV